jgi:effector-binding domain-containing protein
VPAEGDIQIKVIPAGSYVVTRFTGLSTITETWKRLAAWLESSPYRFGYRQGLEELLTPIDTPVEE